MVDEEQAPAQQEKTDSTLKPEKVYVKDVSFETPNSPEIFRIKWEPVVSMVLDSDNKSLGGDLYEVVLSVTITVNTGDKTVYLAEVHQAGIFTITGLTEEQIRYGHHVFCLSFLHPYASAAISDLVAKGGFPQFIVPPVNFDQRYTEIHGDGENTSEPEVS